MDPMKIFLLIIFSMLGVMILSLIYTETSCSSCGYDSEEDSRPLLED